VAGKPKRPYLLRALYEWIVDSDLTPYLLVSVDSDQVHVPSEYVSEGKIVLNISPMAVRDLAMEVEAVSFSGRFGGRPFPVFVPMPSVMAVYAKESGEGMMFDPEYATEQNAPEPPPDTPGGPAAPDPDKPGGGGGHLKVVK
jgi:stringent starvation protein B